MTPPPEARTPCPICRAPVDARVISAGFGSKRDELCGQCGHTFGPAPATGE